VASLSESAGPDDVAAGHARRGVLDGDGPITVSARLQRAAGVTTDGRAGAGFSARLRWVTENQMSA